MVLGSALSSDNSLVVLKLCSLNLVATKLTCLKLHNHFQGCKNYVDVKFPRVIKSSIDKLLSKLVKKCFEIGFFKLVCLKKNPCHV